MMKHIRNFFRRLYACMCMLFCARNNNWLVIYQDRDYDCVYRWDDDCDKDITGSMVKTVSHEADKDDWLRDDEE